jgi:hypothetical protein
MLGEDECEADRQGVAFGVSAPDAVTGSVCVYRVVVPRHHGTWSGPYHLERTMRGVGTFTVADSEGRMVERECEYEMVLALPREVAHAPLRYDPRVVFGAEGREAAAQEVAITVGELLHAVFLTLGFNGTPEDRVAMRSALNQRMAELGVEPEGQAGSGG